MYELIRHKKNLYIRYSLIPKYPYTPVRMVGIVGEELPSRNQRFDHFMVLSFFNSSLIYSNKGKFVPRHQGAELALFEGFGNPSNVPTSKNHLELL